MMLHQFAERLARHIHINEQLAASLTAALQTAVEQLHIAVAKRLQALQRNVRQAFAVVVEGDSRITTWNPRKNLQLQFRQRYVHGKQWMSLGKRCFFTDVYQGQFLTVQQRLTNVGKRSGGGCGHRV